MTEGPKARSLKSQRRLHRHREGERERERGRLVRGALATVVARGQTVDLLGTISVAVAFS